MMEVTSVQPSVIGGRYQGRLGLQQRVLPGYRVPFFDLLAGACQGGLGLFAGMAREEESVEAGELKIANYRSAENIHLFGGAFYLCYQKGLIRWLADWNPDALIMEANPRYLATSPAVKWMRARGRKVVGWGLGAPIASSSSSVFGRGVGARAWSRFISQFDALISYSRRGADEYAALGFPREKIFVAHNSVSPRPSFKPGLRPSTLDFPTIIFVGRLQARKRVDWLLRCCAEITSRPRLVIVGDGPERGKLESLAKEIYPSAEFVGARRGAELTPYFAQADLFILPGTGGLAVQEAMAHGLPVIVAKGDGTQDDLVRGGNGWQIPPDDYGALAQVTREALADLGRLRRMGEESARIVTEEINIEKMVEAFVDSLK